MSITRAARLVYTEEERRRRNVPQQIRVGPGGELCENLGWSFDGEKNIENESFDIVMASGMRDNSLCFRLGSGQHFTGILGWLL